jgi:hypothetical protein
MQPLSFQNAFPVCSILQYNTLQSVGPYQPIGRKQRTVSVVTFIKNKKEAESSEWLLTVTVSRHSL